MFTARKQHSEAELIYECQHLIAEDLTGPLNMLLDEAEDVLFDLAEKSDNQLKNFYFNAMQEIRLKREDIHSDFKKNFSKLISSQVNNSQQNRITRFFSNRRKPTSGLPMEESLAFDSAVSKLNQGCGQALLSLDKNMSGILGSVELEKLFNPESVCIAFQRACGDIESGLEVRLMLFRLFEKYGNSGLKQAYANLERKLTKKNVRTAKDQDEEDITDNSRLLVANIRIKQEINKHVASAIIPEFMRQFLRGHWYKLLLKIYLKQGMHSRAWKQAILVVDDLARLFNSKSQNYASNRDEEIEYLLQRFQNGMNIISVPLAMQNQFIEQVIAYNRFLYKKSGKKFPNPKTAIKPIPSAAGKGMLPFMNELLVDNKWPK